MKLGSGKYTYEWDGNWAKLPQGTKFGFTHGIITDKQDRVFVHSTCDHAVMIFDGDGNFIKSWGKEWESHAHGMFYNMEDGKEFLYLTSNGRQDMVKTTLDGEVVMKIGMPPVKDVYAKPETYRPTDTAIAPNGDIYVTDGYGESWIHRYDKTGRHIQSWGGSGSEPGKMNCPHGIWIDTRKKDPEVYVADRGNNRLQIFTLDGKHLRFVTAELRRPCCFFQFGEDMYIPDLDSRVTIFDRNDKLITHLGDSDLYKTSGWPNIQYKLQPGKFSSPHACCVDSRGDIYVSEWISDGRVTKLRRVGA
jgi:hypothetical protein